MNEGGVTKANNENKLYNALSKLFNGSRCRYT